MTPRARFRPWSLIGSLACIAIVLIALPFVQYAADLGWRGLTTDLAGISRFWTPAPSPANPAIFGHMIAGAVLTFLAPLQLIPIVRRRWPRVHRASGYIVATTALIAGTGGLAYIALRGTIGGPLMSVAFALYGGLVLLSAVMAVRHARARDFQRHRAWALRLFVLAIGSWIYRVHYGLWYEYAGGAATNYAFTGAFDRFNLFALSTCPTSSPSN